MMTTMTAGETGRRVTGHGGGEAAVPLLSPRMLAAVGRCHLKRSIEAGEAWEEYVARSRDAAELEFDDWRRPLVRHARRNERCRIYLALARGRAVEPLVSSQVIALGVADAGGAR